MCSIIYTANINTIIDFCPRTICSCPELPIRIVMGYSSDSSNNLLTEMCIFCTVNNVLNISPNKKTPLERGLGF